MGVFVGGEGGNAALTPMVCTSRNPGPDEIFTIFPSRAGVYLQVALNGFPDVRG